MEVLAGVEYELPEHQPAPEQTRIYDAYAGAFAVIQSRRRGRRPTLPATAARLMERRLAELPTEEWNNVQVDITLRKYLLDDLAHSFPVQLYGPYTDSKGNLSSRPVFVAANPSRPATHLRGFGEGLRSGRIMIDATHLKAHRTAASLLKSGSSPTYRAHERRAELQASHRLQRRGQRVRLG